MGFNTDILDDERISLHGIVVYFILSKYAGKDGTCWPSIRTIAKASRLSKPTTVKAIKELVNTGHLQITNRTSQDNGADISNMYLLPGLTRVNHINTGVKEINTGGNDINTPCKGGLLPRVNHVNTNLSNINLSNELNNVSEEEKRIIDFLPKINGYQFDEKKDLLQVRDWLEKFPADHILNELDKFNAWWRDNGDRFKKPNYRSRITNWLKGSKVEIKPVNKTQWLT